MYRRNSETVEPNVTTLDGTDDPTTEFIGKHPNTEQQKRNDKEMHGKGMVRTSTVGGRLGRMVLVFLEGNTRFWVNCQLPGNWQYHWRS